MSWIFERGGLRASLMGTWVTINRRINYDYSVPGNKGTLTLNQSSTVPSMGFDVAAFAKFGPLMTNVGISPSWMSTHDSVQIRAMLGVAIPLGPNSELRIMGGYRSFTSATTDSGAEVTRSLGPALQIDMAALLGNKGALVMMAEGGITSVQEDIQPVVALGGEYLFMGGYEFAEHHVESERAINRANEALQMARGFVGEERLRSEMKWHGFDAIERAALSIINLGQFGSRAHRDALSDLRDRAYAAAKYAAEYAVYYPTKGAAQQLLKEIHLLPFEFRSNMANFIAKDTFGVLQGIRQEGNQLKKWINDGGRPEKFIRQKLDHYGAVQDRLQSLISEIIDGNVELLNLLAGTSHAIRCLQGKTVSCDRMYLSISRDQLARDIEAKNGGTPR